MNYNTKKREISALVSLGFRILEVINSDNDSTFYSVDTFESSIFSTTSSVDFNHLVGKDITEFLLNTNMTVNLIDLRGTFDSYLQKEVKMKIDFSNRFKWKLFKLD